MNEDFIAFIWKFQLFDHNELKIHSGESLSILTNGYQNNDSGPDFMEAEIRIGSIKWSGAVELHINASYWDSHRHYEDENYNNVILHVVWSNDKEIKRRDGTLIPTLEIKDRVDKHLIENYFEFKESIYEIPCQNHFTEVSSLVKMDMIHRVLFERLSRKANSILHDLESNKNDWEQQCFQSLCTYFGFRLNNESFSRLSKSIPYSVIRRHVGKLSSIESLIFGQSGWLEDDFESCYHQELTSEYRLLLKKHQLKRSLDLKNWKFNRTRPANFPTLRMAQLSALLNSSSRLFDYFIYTNYEELKHWLRTDVSGFWKDHYHFAKDAKSRMKNSLGIDSVNILIINAIVPLRFAYGIFIDNIEYSDSAINLLHDIKPEKNRIISKWNRIGQGSGDAGMSQGLIELFQSYCCKKKCLSCKIGNSLLRKNEIVM